MRNVKRWSAACLGIAVLLVQFSLAAPQTVNDRKGTEEGKIQYQDVVKKFISQKQSIEKRIKSYKIAAEIKPLAFEKDRYKKQLFQKVFSENASVLARINNKYKRETKIRELCIQYKSKDPGLYKAVADSNRAYLEKLVTVDEKLASLYEKLKDPEKDLL